MAPVSENERKIIVEFCHLLEKSKQLFNGLRELSPYDNFQWQSQFSRTFDIYAKLWKHQQRHRTLLDVKYGLKRWQIGEIASKIGQLYYHFYLRSSEITYLLEAYSFYSAIRSRGYYNLAAKEVKCELMVKKLRYYARFIVVTILLRQQEMIRVLVTDLEKQIIAYARNYDPDDEGEWLNVVDEVKAFLRAEPGLLVVHPEDVNKAIKVNGRLNRQAIPPIARTLQMSLKLHKAVIVGSGNQLVKFSELTIDMFRMVQNLEWETEEPIETVRTPGHSDIRCVDGNINPVKHLLFKPSVRQVLTFLSTTMNEIHKNGVMLFYLSGDGCSPLNEQTENADWGQGGLFTSIKTEEATRSSGRETKSGAIRSMNKHALYPGDVQSYTRVPLFMIIDSDNSTVFKHVDSTFGPPVLVLMSPTSLPATIHDRSAEGKLFTLFLHNPIAGLCNTCDIFDLPFDKWERASSLRDIFMKEAMRLLVKTNIDHTYQLFLGCDMLRVFIVRFVFCACCLRLHKDFRSQSNLPLASPPLPEELLENYDLRSIILEIADIIGIRKRFYDLPQSPGPSRDY